MTVVRSRQPLEVQREGIRRPGIEGGSASDFPIGPMKRAREGKSYLSPPEAGKWHGRRTRVHAMDRPSLGEQDPLVGGVKRPEAYRRSSPSDCSPSSFDGANRPKDRAVGPSHISIRRTSPVWTSCFGERAGARMSETSYPNHACNVNASLEGDD